MKKIIIPLLLAVIMLSLNGCGVKQQSIAINYGETAEAELGKEYPALTWTTADKEIADVNGGRITGIAPGKTTVTAMSKGKPVVEISVEVNTVEITGIFLNQSTLTLESQEETQLKYSLVPENASDYGISWKSVNEDIASVDENGEVKAVGIGMTTIICSSASGVMGTCEVTVNPPSAIELLNERERGLFGYMTQSMLTSFYNASAVRIRNIYGTESTADTVWTLDIQGTNKLGGTLFKQYTIIYDRSNGSYTYVDVSSLFNQSNAIALDRSIVDYAKLNAALEEYWKNSGMN